MIGLLKVVDKYSLLRAIVFAKAKADLQFFKLKYKGIDTQSIDNDDKASIKKYTNLCEKLQRNRNDCQRKDVNIFAKEMRITFKDSYDLEDLEEVHGRHYYRIHLFQVTGDKCTHLWSGATPSQRNIIIIKNNGQFDVPKNMHLLLKRSYFCCNCLEICRHKHSHRCESTCRLCGISNLICNVVDDNFSKQCDNCNIVFTSMQCFERHRKKSNNGGSRCNIVQFCKLCSRFLNTKNFAPGETHVCGASEFCKKCCRHVEPLKTHACYTRMPSEAAKTKYKEKEKTVKVIAFDLECSQSTEIEDGTFKFLEDHQVVCAVAKKACYECFEARRFNKNVDCVKCGRNKIVFSYCNTDNASEDFINWLFLPEHDGSYVFAHYGGRYDYLLIIQTLLKMKIKPDVIMNGKRLIAGTVTHNNCTLYLRDSYNLIPLALGNFKKAFGLKSCDDKGEFPFQLIQEKYYHSTFNGLPPIRYYGIDGKSEEKREDFLKWYNSYDPNDYVFDFDDELLTYCEKDVDLLLMGLIEYRHAMIKLTTWDPIPAVCTLPAFTSFILRCDHIKPGQLCNFPDNGFSFNRQQSPIAIKWIKWQMEKTGEHIQHVENGGDFGTETRDSFGTLHEMAMDRLKKLSQVYTVISAWEFDVKKELARNKEMRDFFNNCESSRLVLRTSMQGGRTEAHARLAKSTNDKKLVYFDVNSLYPTVMSTCDLPVSPAEVKRDGFPPVPSREFNFTGLGHVRILPPRHLRYPLLGIKMNNTLLFCLCRLCGSQKSSATCNHTDDQRSIVGTWTHREIQKALSLGYVILAYYEIWIFKKFSNTIFKDYIKTFYTVKISSSGWPKWVKTPEDKKKCLQNYKDTMGIELTEDQIQDNPSLRSVSKMLLNTSWGKFAQNPNVNQTLFCDADEMGEILFTKMDQLSTFHKVTRGLYIVSLAMNDEEVHSCSFGNVPLACYITSEARMILYSMLEASNGSALYNDTDSIIALIPLDPNLNPFKFMLGDGLGKLTDETPGKLIRRIVLGGAKQYAMELVDEKTGKKSYEKKVYKAVNDKGFYIYGKVFPFGFNYAHEEEPIEYDDSEETAWSRVKPRILITYDFFPVFSSTNSIAYCFAPPRTILLISFPGVSSVNFPKPSPSMNLNGFKL
ncbi:hypothetical protein PRIPAC_79763, partial [Pristionchus pacificus]|uniref:DNA-directed DNA polymerase n=1 Tax=Pristionchus pacificus TaxID=54126 RepID=A0A2A6CKW6_PRIPA